MRRLVIRADDLGYSEGVNYGIARCVQAGLVRSVGVMANMDAAAHGAELLAGFDVAIGLHACVSAGAPVSDPHAIPSLVDGEGRFLASSAFRSAPEDFVIFEEACCEVRAQLARLQKLIGRRPDYLDVHAVSSGNFLRAIAAVAAEEDLPVSLLPGSDGTLEVGSSRVRMSIPATEAARAAEDSGSCAACLAAVLSGFDRELAAVGEGEVAMTVCHPGYVDYPLAATSSVVWSRPIEVEALCSLALARLVERHGFALCDYRTL